MSENIRNNEERKEELKSIIKNLREEKDIPAMKKRFSKLLKNLSPEEVAAAEQALIEEGMPVEEVQRLCGIHVSAFEDALSKTAGAEQLKGAHSIAGHPIDTYRRENRELKKILKKLGSALGGFFRPADPEKIISALERLSEVEIHYARKENQLFPYLEQAGFTGPSKVMWGRHDEIRKALKDLKNIFSGPVPGDDLMRGRSRGRELIGSMKKMIFMEEKILFPTSLRKLPEDVWKEIRRGEAEIGYAWIKPGNLYDPSVVKSSQVTVSAASGEIELSVGRLMPYQIDLMLKNLPLDITYVDENDRVRYYSQGKERIFPRSPGIIGRTVQNCHPPDSVHIVQKIVDDFKARRRNEAEFWIQMGGKFIHICYYPLFENDVYKGVIEVSQDIAHFKSLEGEKRLLDEEDRA